MGRILRRNHNARLALSARQGYYSLIVSGEG